MTTNKRYVTEKDITSFKAYKIKNKNPTTVKEFEEVLLNLEDQKYYSNTAEHRKIYQRKKKIKVPKVANKRQIKGFENIINSYLKSFVNDATYNSLLINDYLFHKKPLRIYKITVIEKEIFKSFKGTELVSIPQLVEFQYIDNDVIYLDKFVLKFRKIKNKKNTINQLMKAKITISRSMKAPFPLEYQNINGWMAKRMFRLGFNDYYKEINSGFLKGILK